MERDLCNQECESYSVNIQGNASGVQIQQGAVNSSQFQNVNQELDFDKVAEVLHEISKYSGAYLMGLTTAGKEEVTYK